MQITFNTAETSMEEATALIALLASLGGRLPSTGQHFAIDIDVPKPPVSSVTAGNDGLTVTNGADTPEATTDGNTTSTALAATNAGTSVIMVNGAEILLDSKGTPWDARIHSESRAMVAGDVWRKRRGVSDEAFAEVMAELAEKLSELKNAALVGHPDDDAAPPPPPADEEVPLAPTVPADEQVPAPPAPTVETPSEPEPAASAPVAGDPQPNGGQFADFASFVAAVAKHGKTYAELNEMAGVVGVAAFKDLKDHADKWDMFFSMIG